MGELALLKEKVKKTYEDNNILLQK